MSTTSNSSVRRPWPRALALAASIAAVAAVAGAGAPGAAIAAVEPGAAVAAQASAPSVEQAVRDALAGGEQPAVIVKFRGKADLSGAYAIADRDARATFVYEALTRFASSQQRQAQQTLASQFHLSAEARDYTVLWIDNSIAISRLSDAMLAELAADPNVESIRTQKVIPLPQEPEAEEAAPWMPNDAVSSLAHIKVPDVWALGYKGAGIVVANIDAGVRYTHRSLVDKYRGNLGGGTFDHNYNWYDPYNHSAAPRYTDAHGSHTMGTMVGDGGTATTQIGAAPDAKWMACIGFGLSGAGATDAGLLECGQWTLAPYPTSGTGTPDPTKHPDVVNNSWGDCGRSYDSWYENVIEGWIAAGIAPVFSNGNASNCGYPSNPPLNTVGNPARSGKVLGIGSTGTTNGSYASHSNKGPTDNPNPGLPTYPDPAGFPNVKPNVVAPGVSIYSASSTSDTAYYLNTGTSMSAPAASGVIALMWSAASCLKGDYARTGTILMQTATRIPVATGSPADGPGNVPNQATGWGEIDALAAVNAGIAACAGGDVPPTVATAFAPASVAVDADSVATITLGNANATAATLTADLVDALPAGLVAASASTTCGGTASSTAGEIRLAAGATIPASGSCTITANVHASAAGSYVNTIAAGALQTDKGDNATAASATLTVTGGGTDPNVVCSGPLGTSIPQTFDGLYINFVTGQTGTSEVPGFDFNPYLNSGNLQFYWGGSASGNGGVVAAANGPYLVLAPGAEIGPSSVFSVTTTATANFVAGVDGYLGVKFVNEGTGRTNYGYLHLQTTAPNGFPATIVDYCYNKAGDPITIAGSSGGAAPTVAKAFAPASVAAGTPSTLTITLANTQATPATLGAALTDTFPSGLAVAPTPAAATTCTGGSGVSATAGSGSVTLAAGAKIPAGGACTVTVAVTAAAAGSYANTIAAGALQTDLGNNAAAANATLTVTGGSGGDPVAAVTPNPLSLTVEAGASGSTPLHIANTGGGTLTYSIAESAASHASPSSYKTARAAKRLDAAPGRTMKLQRSLAGGSGFFGKPVLLDDTTISQMADNTPGDEGVSCGAQDGSSTSDNSWWRRFYFNEHPQVGASANVTAVTISAGSEGPNGVPVTINLYTIAHSTPVDTIPTSGLTLIGSGSGTVDSGGVSVTIPVTGLVDDTAGKDLVVEYHIDGADGGQFAPGANATAETHPTFLSSTACGVDEPTTAADIDFPDFHLTMVVHIGEGGTPSGCQNPSDVPWLSETPVSGSVAAGASADVTVSANAGSLVAGSYSANLCVTTNDPAQPLITVPVSLTVTPGAITDRLFCDGFDGTACDGGGTPGDIVTGTIDQPVVKSGDGSTFDFVTGTYAGYAEGRIDDLNLYYLTGTAQREPGMYVYWYGDAVPEEFQGLVGGVVAKPGDTDFAVLQSGATIGPSSPVSAASVIMSNWLATSDGYIGIAFYNEQTNAVNYGYIHMTTTAPEGFPARVLEYAYDKSGAAITIP
jgi:hypothetical protein